MAMNLEAARRLIWTAAWAKDHPEAFEDGSVESKPFEHMAIVFTGNAVQKITEQGMELFGGMGVIAGMPIEKYVRDAHVQKHILFQVPLKFRIAETLAGYKREVKPLLIGGN
jgi:acyl-CoA dehydrogenase